MNQNYKCFQNAQCIISQTPVDHPYHIVLSYMIRIEEATGRRRFTIEELRSLIPIGEYEISREQFQYEVLIPLKVKCAIATIVSGRNGGVFIPDSDNEICEAFTYIYERISSEIRNLETLVSGTPCEKRYSEISRAILGGI